MKIINLNESQFGRLFENGIENFGQSNIPEFQTQDEVVTTSKITDKDGDTKNSVSPTTDKFAKQRTPQQWGSVGGRKSSNTI